MKYCTKCGCEAHDDAVICIKCGCALATDGVKQQPKGATAAKVFMTITCALYALMAIFALVCAIFIGSIMTPPTDPGYTNDDGFANLIIAIWGGFGIIYLFGNAIALAWCAPMTVSFYKKSAKGERVSTAFKICTLIFVNAIAGIIMLCNDEI